MDIKIFEAQTMKDAVQAVRKEFGKEAVIISSKEKYQENKKYVEIKAVRPAGARGQTIKRASMSSEQFPENLDERLDVLERKLEKISTQIVSRRDIIGLNADIEELKRMSVAFFQKTRLNQPSGPYAHLLGPFNKKLQIMGVDDGPIKSMNNDVEALLTQSLQNKNATENNVREAIIKWILKKISIFPRWEKNELNSTSIQAIIGGAGVGKTSTAIKIATQGHLEGLKVALVSCGNESFGGAESLRISAKVLGIQFEAIDQEDKIFEIIPTFGDCDFIVVDTMSKSPRFPSQIDKLLKLKKDNFEIDFHLAMAMTDRSSQMHRTIKAFSKIGISSIIFTKLDESWAYGEILNLAIKWNIPLSYFSTGVKIPDDIERATRERVIERIIGAK